MNIELRYTLLTAVIALGAIVAVGLTAALH